MVVGGVVLKGCGALRSQEPPVQPAFRAEALSCAGFSEMVRGELTIHQGSRERRERLGRRGYWTVRAVPADSAPVRGQSFLVEGWYDSLEAWRDINGERLTPDTDGLVGGRYRGWLARDGGFEAQDQPFVPDQLAEVYDPRRALAELWPTLPDRPLRVGERWGEEPRLEIVRLPDSTAGGVALNRFRITAARQRSDSVPVGDSLAAEAGVTEREEGRLDWHPTHGMVRWERRISSEVRVAPGGAVKRPVRSVLEQDVVVTRLQASTGCRSSTR